MPTPSCPIPPLIGSGTNVTENVAGVDDANNGDSEGSGGELPLEDVKDGACDNNDNDEEEVVADSNKNDDDNGSDGGSLCQRDHLYLKVLLPSWSDKALFDARTVASSMVCVCVCTCRQHHRVVESLTIIGHTHARTRSLTRTHAHTHTHTHRHRTSLFLSEKKC